MCITFEHGHEIYLITVNLYLKFLLTTDLEYIKVFKNLKTINVPNCKIITRSFCKDIFLMEIVSEKLIS